MSSKDQTSGNSYRAGGVSKRGFGEELSVEADRIIEAHMKVLMR